MKMVATMERGILPTCAYITAAAPLISKAYAARYGVTPVTVLNVFPLAMAPAAPAADPVQRAPVQLRAYWFSQTIGLDRGLQAFIKAMALAKCHVTLDIRGGNKRGDGDRLVELARDLGIAGRVSILPPAPPDEMVALASTYDVGLSLETDVSENRGICLTNKTFTYLLAGIPTVMSDTPAQRTLAPDLGAAAALVSLSDPVAIAAVLDRLAGSTADLAEAKRTAWRLGRERYNWDVEKEVLMKTVDMAFAGRGDAAGRMH
jgi:glycosyltransferase involved in cell wall biosynthesis